MNEDKIMISALNLFKKDLFASVYPGLKKGWTFDLLVFDDLQGAVSSCFVINPFAGVNCKTYYICSIKLFDTFNCMNCEELRVYLQASLMDRYNYGYVSPQLWCKEIDKIYL